MAIGSKFPQHWLIVGNSWLVIRRPNTLWKCCNLQACMYSSPAYLSGSPPKYLHQLHLLGTYVRCICTNRFVKRLLGLGSAKNTDNQDAIEASSYEVKTYTVQLVAHPDNVSSPAGWVHMHGTRTARVSRQEHSLRYRCLMRGPPYKFPFRGDLSRISCNLCLPFSFAFVGSHLALPFVQSLCCPCLYMHLMGLPLRRARTCCVKIQ